MSETQDIFDVSELNTISFKCPDCRTEVIFRADEQPDGSLSKNCPACHKEIPNAGHVLALYRGFYTQAVALKSSAKLRGPKR
jgi:predicted RNA-binding Zn-ribbon protein involved in translation (DUF1610 family)